MLGGSFVESRRSAAGNVLVVALAALGGSLVGFGQLEGGGPLVVVGLGLLTAGFVYHVSDTAGDDGGATGEEGVSARSE